MQYAGQTMITFREYLCSPSFLVIFVSFLICVCTWTSTSIFVIMVLLTNTYIVELDMTGHCIRERFFIKYIYKNKVRYPAMANSTIQMLLNVSNFARWVRTCVIHATINVILMYALFYRKLES